MNYISRLISYALHPLLVPMYVLLFIFYGNPLFSQVPWMTKLYSLAVVFVTLFLIPLLSLLIFKHFHLITSYNLIDSKERVYPIFVTVLFGFIGFGLLNIVAYTEIVQQLFLVLIILLSVFAVITIRWKISMHMTAIGGFCGFVCFFGMEYPGDVRIFLACLLLVAGSVGTSRLYLERHTPAQVYAGFLLGFFFVLGIFL